MEYHDAILREYYEYLNFLKWEKFENDKNIPPMLKKKKKIEFNKADWSKETI